MIRVQTAASDEFEEAVVKLSPRGGEEIELISGQSESISINDIIYLDVELLEDTSVGIGNGHNGYVFVVTQQAGEDNKIQRILQPMSGVKLTGEGTRAEVIYPC